jgi:hypothetical protein
MTDIKENLKERSNPRSIQRVLDSYFERNLEKLSKLNRSAIDQTLINSSENQNESKTSKSLIATYFERGINKDELSRLGKNQAKKQVNQRQDLLLEALRLAKEECFSDLQKLIDRTMNEMVLYVTKLKFEILVKLHRKYNSNVTNWDDLYLINGKPMSENQRKQRSKQVKECVKEFYLSIEDWNILKNLNFDYENMDIYFVVSKEKALNNLAFLSSTEYKKYCPALRNLLDAFEQNNWFEFQ